MIWPPLLGALVGDAEIEAFFTDDADLAAMLRFEVALALAEADAGLIIPQAAARIEAVSGSFVPDLAALAKGLAQDGVVVPALISQLRAAVGQPHAAAVHLGATSQDVIDTSLMLRLKPALGVIAARLVRTSEGLARISARDGHKTLQAHTRMQVALPFTAADKIAAWAGPLHRHAGRLSELEPRLLVLQLGGPIGTRAELLGQGAEIAAGMAARLGLHAGPCWQSQRDGIADLGAWLSLVCGALGKIGQDVALLAQNEVAAVRLAAGGASSAMAHKHNPVAAEVLVTLARFNAGLLGTLHQALVHENERSGAAWTLEWMVLPPMLVTTAAALRIASTLLDGLSFV